MAASSPDELDRSRRTNGVRELTSGIDSLYLSMRADVPEPLLATLENAREAAAESNQPVSIRFGGADVDVRARAFGMYRFALSHPHGEIGITPSKNLPAVRVQPRAEFLHGVGPVPAVDWFRDLVVAEVGPVFVGASRIDVHADVQGWDLEGNDSAPVLVPGRGP